MRKFNRFASITIIAAVLLILPYYTKVHILPSYGNFVVGNTEKAMVDIAAHIAASLTIQSTISPDIPLPKEFTEEIHHIKTSINLWKVKVFAPGGEIVYSSTPKDIGNMTKKGFFPEIVQSRKFRSRIDTRNVISQDGKPAIRYLLESYVPIIREGETIGVFEIYYDVTSAMRGVHQLKEQYNTILWWAALGVGVALLMRLSNLFVFRSSDG